MAIELGQLKDYNAEKGMKFEWGNKAYHINPTVEEGLTFQVALHERDTKREELEAKLKDKNLTDEKAKALAWEYRMHTTFGTHEIMAPLFGSKFHYPTKTKGPRFEGGVLGELQASGMNTGTIDRLITTMYLSMVNTEDVAMEYMKVGKLDKAISLVQERENAESATTETPQAPGETDGTD